MLFDGRDDIRRELRVSVKDQESVRLVVSPSFGQLQYDPQSVWLTAHMAVQNLPPVVVDDEEAVQNPERQRRHGEKVHGSDCFTMSFCWIGYGRCGFEFGCQVSGGLGKLEFQRAAHPVGCCS
jgi:hypothetical protein